MRSAYARIRDWLGHGIKIRTNFLGKKQNHGKRINLISEPPNFYINNKLIHDPHLHTVSVDMFEGVDKEELRKKIEQSIQQSHTFEYKGHDNGFCVFDLTT
jgi:hypothetical protein